MGLFSRRQPWVIPDGDDHYVLNLPAGLPEVLVHLGSELRDLLATDSDVVYRVFPVAYPDDAEREAGYQVLMRGELIDRHQAGIDLIAHTATAEALTGDELTRWLTTINALRLILGTALDIDEDSEPDLDEDDPNFPVQHLYLLTSALLSHILTAMAEPDPDEA